MYIILIMFVCYSRDDGLLGDKYCPSSRSVQGHISNYVCVHACVRVCVWLCVCVFVCVWGWRWKGMSVCKRKNVLSITTINHPHQIVPSTLSTTLTKCTVNHHYQPPSPNVLSITTINHPHQMYCQSPLSTTLTKCTVNQHYQPPSPNCSIPRFISSCCFLRSSFSFSSSSLSLSNSCNLSSGDTSQHNQQAHHVQEIQFEYA